MNLDLLANGKFTGQVSLRDADGGLWFLSHTFNMVKTLKPPVFILKPMTKLILGPEDYNYKLNAYNIWVGPDNVPPGVQWTDRKGIMGHIHQISEGDGTEAFYFKTQGQYVIIQSQWNGYLYLNKDGILSCDAGVHNATPFESIEYIPL